MAANAQGKYEAKVDERNAKLEGEAAKDAFARRNVDQMRLWRRVSQQLGEQRAGAAAAGLDVNFGSPSDLQQDTLQIGMEDSSTLNENTIKEVKGYDINAWNYRSQGAAAKMRGKAALTGSIIGATGTLLSAASQMGKSSFGPSPGAAGGTGQ
jgi:hypothetical protein